ncbi:MAG TPA: DNA cytosine methyltransferase [Microbacterium sp.]|nr:DNA cytosine methyltransferase [Microbacterium sp.]
MRPQALDLFCCAGGASDGFCRAGFDVTGYDREDQPEYPYAFAVQDVLSLSPADIRAFDFVWASPPCQAFTAYKRRKEHVRPALNLIPQTRELLRAAGVPYVIENVPGAPLENPVTLCGSMFGLDVQRHRIFETSFPVLEPTCDHGRWTPRFPGATNRAPMSRKTVEVGVYRISVETQRRAMGVERPVSLGKLSQMVPPAYAEFLALQARVHIMSTRRAA